MEYVYLICLLVAIGMMVWLKLYDVRNSVSQYLSFGLNAYRFHTLTSFLSHSAPNFH